MMDAATKGAFMDLANTFDRMINILSLMAEQQNKIAEEQQRQAKELKIIREYALAGVSTENLRRLVLEKGIEV